MSSFDIADVLPRYASWPASLPIEEWLHWGVHARGWERQTAVTYVRPIAAAARWLQEVRGVALVEATTRELTAWLESCETGSARTYSVYRSALVALFDWRNAIEARPDQPARQIPSRRIPKAIPKALTPTQARAVLAAASHLGEDVAVAVGLMMYAGLRQTEARTLSWSDVGDDGWLHVRGKGSHERAVKIHADLAELLAGWHERCPSTVWVVPSRRDPTRPLSASGIAYRVDKVAAAADVDELTPHVARHTFATRMLAGGASVRIVQEALGHAWVGTTMGYLRVRPDDVADAVDRIAW